MNAPLLEGRCLCGAVAYGVADAFLWAVNCHCSNCRRTTGSAFKPLARIEGEKLALTRGADRLLIYGGTDAHDVHCGTCGSFLFSRLEGGRFVHVALGTLDDAPSVRPSAHMFVGSKAPWYEITDDLPQYDTFAP